LLLLLAGESVFAVPVALCEAGSENPFLAGGLALSHARCQGRGVGVHRSAAKILDRKSAWFERRVSAGRAREGKTERIERAN